ncbi:MAG: hypothetical protein QNJ90_01810 [Planctomycetota bacterium]|nr:hypothetical protein [Planctomycetota bacterium]
MRHLPLALLALASLALLGTGPDAAAAEKLVPANYRAQNDVHGMAYTCDQHGRVQSQYGWLYSGFTINRSGLNVQRRLMKPGGGEYVLEGRIGAIEVQRRFKVDRKLGGVRVVEVLRNTSAQPVQASVIVFAQLNSRYQRVVTNTGRAVSGVLQKKESGVAGLMRSPVQGAALYYLCSASSRVKPSVLNSNNHQLQFHYNLQLPPRSRVALAHGGVILRMASMPSPSALDKHFKPFRSRRWTRDLPKDVRRGLVNTRSRGAGSDGGIPTIEQVLEIPPTSLDQLAFSDQTLLQGTATCAQLEVETAHGRVDVPFDRVAALVGSRHAQLEPRVYLRDGQKLVGAITAKALRFEMSSGMAIDLDIEKVDRLVLREKTRKSGDAEGDSPALVPAGADVAYLIETFEGNRLRTEKETESIRVATQWGEMTIAIEELQRLYLAGEDLPGYWVELRDESRFRAFVRDGPLAMKSDLFGSVTFRPHQIRRIAVVRRKRPGQEDDIGELLRPHLVLAGGDLFVGRIDLDALHFLAPGGTVPQPPSQLRVLHNELDGERPGPADTLRFRAEVWGGGHITGELRELVVPVETARGTLRVPVRDIVDVLVPTPIVPEVLRVRIRTLIRDLGHPSWEKREAASSALAELGELTKQSLQQALRETKDPEVERRIRRLLDKI